MCREHGTARDDFAHDIKKDWRAATPWDKFGTSTLFLHVDLEGDQ